MKDDGLLAIIQSDGVKWYVGGYKLTDVSVCEAWNINRKQMDRLKDYILVNDPFME
tara:strand:- start:313 stop:480 length:168 start_codon:yes stop_codon:yes gene_type:complete